MTTVAMDKKTGKKMSQAITTKQLSWSVAILAGVISIVGWVHGAIVIPQVEKTSEDIARKVVKEVLEGHNKHLHPGSVSQVEMQYIKDALTELKSKLNSIENKLDSR